MHNYSTEFFSESKLIIDALNADAIENLAMRLLDVRNNCGRLFIVGVGGSAASASHAVNDFRKLAGFEAYAPTDNVSELTARTNDEGWDTVFAAWLAGSLCVQKMRFWFSLWVAAMLSVMSVPIWFVP